MKITDLQNNRILLEKNIKYMQKRHINIQILVGNFGYIAIPNDTGEKVIKYFIDKSFYLNEIENNFILKEKKVLVPDIELIGDTNIDGTLFFILKLENIRKYKERYSSINIINTAKLGELLSKIHSINFDSGKAYLHGNLHESNFFEDKEGNLGIFDLVSMFYGDIEYDFSHIYINSMYDDNFILDILHHYKFKEYFNFSKMYKFTLVKILEKIKQNQPVKNEGIKGLKLALFKVKSKIGKKLI